jgi:triphosphatase
VNIEREIKLALTPRAEAALAGLAPNRRRLASIYYDTPRQELRRAGIALRLRRDGGRWLQTLKAEGAPHAGLAARAEWELPVRGRSLEPQAFPLDEIRRSTGLDLGRLSRRLRPVFETRFTRRSGLVPLERSGKGELAIDRGSIVAGKRREPIREAELELVSGEPTALLAYAESLELPLAYESKAERGYRLCAGLKPGPQRWRMPEFDPVGPAHAAFAGVFSAALAQAGANAAGMQRSSDPEYLHQLRVGLRRLRAALRAFAPVVQGAKPLRTALGRLTPALGTARDWDVFVETLEKAGAGPGLLRSARRKRSEARRAALATVASPQFQRFLFRALRWLQSSAPRRDITVRALAPLRLERLHRKVLTNVDAETPRERHKLRILVKRLRYACEFFAPAFDARLAKPYIRRLAHLQELLGQLNDITVARRLLRALEAEVPQRIQKRDKRLTGGLGAALAGFRSASPYWRLPERTPRPSPR